MCNFELIPHKNNIINNRNMTIDNRCNLAFFKPVN